MKWIGRALLVAAFATSVTAPVIARELDPCFGRRPNIVGTEGDDTLRGTNGADVIFGAGGDDTIIGRDGSDRVCGGTGNDVVRGDGGDDSIFGATGVDRLYGGDGEDEIYSGGSSTTELETLDGGSGDDQLTGESSPEEMFGGIGSDHIIGGGSLLNVPDQLYGDADNDTIRGAQALLSGGQGDDNLAGGTASFADALGTVQVNLQTGRAIGEGEDELSSVTDVTGSKFDDEIIGDADNNTLQGSDGNDVIEAGDGNDVVDAGAGNDSCAEVEDATNCETTVAAGALTGDADASGESNSIGDWFERNVVAVAIAGGALLVILFALAFRMGRRRVRQTEPA